VRKPQAPARFTLIEFAGGDRHHCDSGGAVAAGVDPGQDEKRRAIRCLSNTKQLTLGWIMYQGDNQEYLMTIGNAVVTSSSLTPDTVSLLYGLVQRLAQYKTRWE